MRDKPIIFTGESVRAILEGRKTQTRRVVKPQPKLNFSIARLAFCADGGVPPPPYQIGQRLWVKERWYPAFKRVDYSSGVVFPFMGRVHTAEANEGWKPNDGWKSPLFMPRWASRLTLEVTEVRVERLQDISEEDAIAEGAQGPGFPASLTNRSAFGKHWHKINGKKHPWKSNPWVWVIEFKLVTLPESTQGSTVDATKAKRAYRRVFNKLAQGCS